MKTFHFTLIGVVLSTVTNAAPLSNQSPADSVVTRRLDVADHRDDAVSVNMFNNELGTAAAHAAQVAEDAGESSVKNLEAIKAREEIPQRLAEGISGEDANTLLQHLRTQDARAWDKLAPAEQLHELELMIRRHPDPEQASIWTLRGIDDLDETSSSLTGDEVNKIRQLRSDYPPSTHPRQMREGSGRWTKLSGNNHKQWAKYYLDDYNRIHPEMMVTEKSGDERPTPEQYIGIVEKQRALESGGSAAGSRQEHQGSTVGRS